MELCNESINVRNSGKPRLRVTKLIELLGNQLMRHIYIMRLG